MRSSSRKNVEIYLVIEVIMQEIVVVVAVAGALAMLASNKRSSQTRRSILDTESPCNSDDGESSMSVCQPTPNSSKRGKKRKSVDDDDDTSSIIISMLGTFLQKIESTLDVIAQRIGYEQDASMNRRKVFPIVDTMEGLSLQEKFQVTEAVVLSNDGRVDVFLSLPEDARSMYVQLLLAGEIGV